MRGELRFRWVGLDWVGLGWVRPVPFRFTYTCNVLQLGLIRLGSVFRVVRFRSRVRFGSVRFGLVGSVRFDSVWLGQVRFGLVWFVSDRG